MYFLKVRLIFAPIAVETMGVWAKEGLKVIENIGQRMTLFTGEKRATNFLLQRHSLDIQRGNVAAVLGTILAGKQLEKTYLI